MSKVEKEKIEVKVLNLDSDEEESEEEDYNDEIVNNDDDNFFNKKIEDQEEINQEENNEKSEKEDINLKSESIDLSDSFNKLFQEMNNKLDLNENNNNIFANNNFNFMPGIPPPSINNLDSNKQIIFKKQQVFRNEKDGKVIYHSIELLPQYIKSGGGYSVDEIRWNQLYKNRNDNNINQGNINIFSNANLFNNPANLFNNPNNLSNGEKEPTISNLTEEVSKYLTNQLNIENENQEQVIQLGDLKQVLTEDPKQNMGKTLSVSENTSNNINEGFTSFGNNVNFNEVDFNQQIDQSGMMDKWKNSNPFNNGFVCFKCGKSGHTSEDCMAYHFGNPGNNNNEVFSNNPFNFGGIYNNNNPGNINNNDPFNFGGNGINNNINIFGINNNNNPGNINNNDPFNFGFNNNAFNFENNNNNPFINTFVRNEKAEGEICLLIRYGKNEGDKFEMFVDPKTTTYDLRAKIFVRMLNDGNLKSPNFEIFFDDEILIVDNKTIEQNDIEDDDMIEIKFNKSEIKNNNENLNPPIFNNFNTQSLPPIPMIQQLIETESEKKFKENLKIFFEQSNNIINSNKKENENIFKEIKILKENQKNHDQKINEIKLSYEKKINDLKKNFEKELNIMKEQINELKKERKN